MLPQPLVSVDGTGDRLPSEVILMPRVASSYGWVAGQLVHPVLGNCLARSASSAVGVVFRGCDAKDSSQQWQWKMPLPETSTGTSMSVLQHQASGQVLERMHAVEEIDIFGLADYRVGADSQRFLLQTCNR